MIVESKAADLSCPFREAVTPCQGAKCMAWGWTDPETQVRETRDPDFSNPPYGSGWVGRIGAFVDFKGTGHGAIWERPHPARKGGCARLGAKP